MLSESDLAVEGAESLVTLDAIEPPARLSLRLLARGKAALCVRMQQHIREMVGRDQGKAHLRELTGACERLGDRELLKKSDEAGNGAIPAELGESCSEWKPTPYSRTALTRLSCPVSARSRWDPSVRHTTSPVAAGSEPGRRCA